MMRNLRPATVQVEAESQSPSTWHSCAASAANRVERQEGTLLGIKLCQTLTNLTNVTVRFLKFSNILVGKLFARETSTLTPYLQPSVGGPDRGTGGSRGRSRP